MSKYDNSIKSPSSSSLDSDHSSGGGYTEGLGERVRYCRKELDMTQGELSNILGVTRQTIYGYESNRMRPPTQMIEKIADLTHYSPAWILFGLGDPSGREMENNLASLLGARGKDGFSSLSQSQLSLIKYILSDSMAADRMAQILWDKALDLER